MGAIFIICISIGIIVAILQGNANAEEVKERGEKLSIIKSQHPDFTPTTEIVGIKNLYTFAIDNINNKILYYNHTDTFIIDFEKIISVELEEDNSIIMQTSTMRTVGGSLLGGALTGGAGMIVGGLSGSSTQKKKVSTVNIKIRLRDINNPSILIPCFNARTMTAKGKSAIKTDSFSEGDLYKQGLADAKKIVDIITVIIDSVDKENSNSKPITENPTTSVADELLKLSELKEKGIISTDEFERLKSKLLES